MNLFLYTVSPEYRRCVDELVRLKQEHGALEAAYRNALGDQRRLKAHVLAANEYLGKCVRDDPGVGGSGGA